MLGCFVGLTSFVGQGAVIAGISLSPTAMLESDCGEVHTEARDAVRLLIG